jgi:outer membrane protein insertion porin family
LQVFYSGYRQEIKLPTELNDCQNSGAAPINGGGGVTSADACYSNGEASLPVRMELAQGAIFTSMVGYSLTYNGLDNNRSPTNGLHTEIKQELAGAGGDVKFLRNTATAKYYFEATSDLIGLITVQGGQISGWGGQNLRMLDHFQMGPNLVRGFAPSGIGPRDLSTSTTQDALGGTMYWGASLEFQVPLYFVPKDFGLRGAVFADAGSLWGYKGPTSWNVTGETVLPNDDNKVRSSVGAGLVWDSPFGPLRFDYAYAVTKSSNDKLQAFRFGGGGKF